jgi:hypothetical protein
LPHSPLRTRVVSSHQRCAHPRSLLTAWVLIGWGRQLLRYNPADRLSASKALQHPFFQRATCLHASHRVEDARAAGEDQAAADAAADDTPASKAARVE